MDPLKFNTGHQIGFAPFDWMRTTFVSLKERLIGKNVYIREIEKSEYIDQHDQKGKLYQFPQKNAARLVERNSQTPREVRATYSQNQIGVLRLFAERWNPFPTSSQKKYREMANQLAADSLEIDFLATQADQVADIIQSGDVVAISTLKNKIEFFKAAFIPISYVVTDGDFLTVEREEELYLSHIARTRPNLNVLKAFLLTLSISSFKDDHVLLSTLVTRLHMYSQALDVVDASYASGLRDLIHTHFRVAFMNQYS